MEYFGQIIMMACCLTFALLFGANAVYGIYAGRLKLDPQSDWIFFRTHRTRFSFLIAGHTVFALGFGLKSAEIFQRLLN